jgi:hypothetical protein
MIPAAGADQAALAFRSGKACYFTQSTADLECTRSLQVLKFEVYRNTGPIARSITKNQRSPDDVWPNPAHSSANISQSDGRNSCGLWIHDDDE